jgi:hypothetical protein
MLKLYNTAPFKRPARQARPRCKSHSRKRSMPAPVVGPDSVPIPMVSLAVIHGSQVGASKNIRAPIRSNRPPEERKCGQRDSLVAPSVGVGRVKINESHRGHGGGAGGDQSGCEKECLKHGGSPLFGGRLISRSFGLPTPSERVKVSGATLA